MLLACRRVLRYPPRDKAEVSSLRIRKGGEEISEARKKSRYNDLCRFRRFSDPPAVCSLCIGWDSNPRIRMGTCTPVYFQLYRLRSDRSGAGNLGIRKGTAPRTAVKGSPDHLHRAFLQLQFSKIFPKKHGKKAANYQSPQLFWVFNRAMICSRRVAGPKTSTKGPKLKIRMSSSVSSSRS